jgi:hypothetical protein
MNITYCEPAAAHSLLPTEPNFYCRFNPALNHAEMNGAGDMVSIGLSYNDFTSGMHITKRGGRGGSHINRRNGVPEYALDPVKMRQLVVRYLEIRAGLRNRRGEGTDFERLQRAVELIRAQSERLEQTASRLCHRYVEAKQRGASNEELKRLEKAIRGVDTAGMGTKNPAELIVGIIYRSYCLGERSCGVAAQLRVVTAVGVRQILHRLAELWTSMQDGTDTQNRTIRSSTGSGEKQHALSQGESFPFVLRHPPSRLLAPRT